MDTKELATRFTYHPPTGTQAPRYERVRTSAHSLALFIVENSPESREQSLALTALDEVVFWTNAAIARRENPVTAEVV